MGLRKLPRWLSHFEMTVMPLTEIRDKTQPLVFGEKVLSFVLNWVTLRLKFVPCVPHTWNAEESDGQNTSNSPLPTQKYKQRSQSGRCQIIKDPSTF